MLSRLNILTKSTLAALLNSSLASSERLRRRRTFEPVWCYDVSISMLHQTILYFTVHFFGVCAVYLGKNEYNASGRNRPTAESFSEPPTQRISTASHLVILSQSHSPRRWQCWAPATGQGGSSCSLAGAASSCGTNATALIYPVRCHCSCVVAVAVVAVAAALASLDSRHRQLGLRHRQNHCTQRLAAHRVPKGCIYVGA